MAVKLESELESLAGNIVSQYRRFNTIFPLYRSSSNRRKSTNAI